MAAKIRIEELPAEVLEKLDIDLDGTPAVDGRLLIMSMIMKDLAGLSSRDALWILRKIITLVEGERDKKARDKLVNKAVNKLLTNVNNSKEEADGLET